MSISTRSKFYFGIVIDSDNKYLDFSEGGAELTATLEEGSYTLTEFLVELDRALEAAGALTYTVSVARATRLITIAASGTFQLLTTSGSHAATSAFSMAGFSGADKTGAATYTGAAGAGYSYAVQYVLQSYISTDDWRVSRDPSVNKSASGRIEVINFGEDLFMQCNIRYITDVPMGTGAPIRSNPTGCANARTFMRSIKDKVPMEFMPNEDAPSTFQKMILESSEEEAKGTAYKLKELIGEKLPGFFETGILKFRVLD